MKGVFFCDGGLQYFLLGLLLNFFLFFVFVFFVCPFSLLYMCVVCMSRVSCMLQPKALRKLIQNHFRQYAQLSESECVYKFFDTLFRVYNFNQERFKCALGVSEFFVCVNV